jgi:hypothetical protein
MNAHWHGSLKTTIGLNDRLALLSALSIKAINPQAPERNHLCRMKTP